MLYSARSPTEMVEQQIKKRGIKDKKVLEAFLSISREKFVPENLKNEAYSDKALPIGNGQTISQPYIVALMTEKIKPTIDDRVLEVGTGSGYQSAILSYIVKEVYTIERIEILSQNAKEIHEKLGLTNINYKIDDGHAGWMKYAPYDSIIVTCAGTKVPKNLVNQLKKGGRLCIPVGYPSSVQELKLITKKLDGTIESETITHVSFVPFVSK